MNCGYKEKVILQFYGELPEAESGAVGEHLASCPGCAAELAVLKALSARLAAFSPEPPRLSAAELLEAARGPGFLERLPGLWRSAALAGACAAAFFAAFHLAGLSHRPPVASWNSGIDSGLDSIEYGIYALEDDMLSSTASDFDFRCDGIEEQRLDIAEKTT